MDLNYDVPYNGVHGLSKIRMEEERKAVVLSHRARRSGHPAVRFFCDRREGQPQWASFRRMQDFCRKESLAQIGHRHREIYLSDPQKTAPADLKTILRYPVRDNFLCD